MIKSIALSIFLLLILATGMYFAGAYTDSDTAITPTVVNGIDLTVSIQTAPMFTCPSTVARYDVIVQNRGNQDADFFRVKIDDTEIPVQGLSRGNVLRFTFERPISSPDIEFQVTVDVTDRIEETDEENNTASQFINSATLGRGYLFYCTPTLTPSRSSEGQPELFAGVKYNTGDGCNVPRRIETVVINNAGDADAGAFTVVINGMEIEIEGLSAGETYEISIADMMTLEARVTVDVKNTVQEINEDNNFYTWMPSTVGAYGEYYIICTPSPTSPAHPLPDLEAEFYYDENVCGGTITHVEIFNRGQADAGTFTVVLNGDEIHRIRGLKSGRSIRIPAIFRYENTEIHVRIDPDNEITEFDETNNTTFIQRLTSTNVCTPTGVSN